MAEMKEGFLCPICMTDLGDLIQLQVITINDIINCFHIYTMLPANQEKIKAFLFKN